ncbi:unnamed protein product, partial [Didymodactylos carnosus]
MTAHEKTVVQVKVRKGVMSTTDDPSNIFLILNDNHRNQNYTTEADHSVCAVYKLYPQRFWILFVFSFLSFNHCMIWLTFSPIALSAEQYYLISESTVDLLLNWGAIVFIPCLPLTYILLNKKNGLRKCVLTFAISVFLATSIRILPLIFTHLKP